MTTNFWCEISVFRTMLFGVYIFSYGEIMQSFSFSTDFHTGPFGCHNIRTTCRKSVYKCNKHPDNEFVGEMCIIILLMKLSGAGRRAR
jgi:hypothetical protein